MAIEPTAENREFSSPDHWVGGLDSQSRDFLTAIELYRNDPSLTNLIPSLRKFTGMGEVLYFRRPDGVTEEKFRELAGHYNTAAEVLIRFLLPDAADQHQLRLEETYTNQEWGSKLQEHFLAATELDRQLARGKPEETGTSRLASLAAARLIRLGQMIFFRLPNEFKPRSRDFQQFFMEAMSRYLGRLDGLAAPKDKILTKTDQAGELPAFLETDERGGYILPEGYEAVNLRDGDMRTIRLGKKPGSEIICYAGRVGVRLKRGTDGKAFLSLLGFNLPKNIAPYKEDKDYISLENIGPDGILLVENKVTIKLCSWGDSTRNEVLGDGYSSRIFLDLPGEYRSLGFSGLGPAFRAEGENIIVANDSFSGRDIYFAQPAAITDSSAGLDK